MIYKTHHIIGERVSPIIIISISIILFACSSTPEPPVVTAFDENIEKATRDIQTSLKMLANTQNALASKVLTPEQIAQQKYTTSSVPPGMNQKLTLHWDGGPIEPAVKTAASAAGYEFRAVGKPPIPAATVRLSAEQKPIIQILEDIGLQAGSAATVDINTQSRVVYLRYGDRDVR